MGMRFLLRKTKDFRINVNEAVIDYKTTCSDQYLPLSPLTPYITRSSEGSCNKTPITQGGCLSLASLLAVRSIKETGQ